MANRHTDKGVIVISSATAELNNKSHHGYLAGPGVQRSAIAAFNPLAAQRSVVQTEVLFHSLLGSGRGDSRIYDKSYQQCQREWAGCSAQEGVANNAISAPKLADFLVYLFRVGLAWHTNSAIVCVVLALDSWNYCSGE